MDHTAITNLCARDPASPKFLRHHLRHDRDQRSALCRRGRNQRLIHSAEFSLLGELDGGFGLYRRRIRFFLRNRPSLDPRVDEEHCQVSRNLRS